MDALEPQLRELLDAHKEYFQITDKGKIECTLNGHTLPPRLDAVSSFIQGAKFQKLSRRHTADHALKKYEPFIVQSKNFPLMLYCALTGQLIDRSVDAIKKHMKGKKFQRAKDRFAADELELKPEPSLESFGVRLPKGQQQQKQQEQPQEEANGAADSDDDAGDGSRPAFWMPEGGSSSSGDEGGSDGGDEAAAGSSGSSEGGDDDAEGMEGVAGPLDREEDGSEGGDPMEEDTDAAAAAAAAAAASSRKAKESSHKAKGKAKRAKQGSSKPAKVPAQNGSAAASVKNRNVQRPSASKKAKH